MLSSAGFLLLYCFLVLSPFSGSGILLRGLDGRRGEKDSVRFIWRGEKASVFSARIPHYALQPKKFCAVWCGPVIASSMARGKLPLI